MGNIRVIAVMLGMALLGAGCKKPKTTEPQPVSIYQYYQVRFFPELDATSAEAYFTYNNQDGSMVRFTNNAAVKMNGEESGFTNYDGGSFSWQEESMQDVVFTFARNDGSTLTNKAEAPQPGYLALEIDTVLHVTDTMRLRWTGLPLQPDEIVRATLTREYDSIDVYNSISADIFDGSHECTFDYAQTSHFVPGTYRVELIKQRSAEVQQGDGTAGGRMIVSVIVMGKVVVK